MRPRRKRRSPAGGPAYLWLRQITVLREDGRQTVIVTNRTDLTAVEVVRRLFRRWRQENYFKYMRKDYPDTDSGLSQGLGLMKGRSYIIAREEWPKVKADIDANLSALDAARFDANTETLTVQSAAAAAAFWLIEIRPA